MASDDALAGANTREDIVRQFEDFLDETLAAEAPPSGLDAELLAEINRDEPTVGNQYDAFAMWSAVTALTQEVKLQGRSFKDLAGAVAAQSPDAAMERVSTELRAAFKDRERDAQREAERRVRREILDGLLDLRESLERGLRTADTVAVAPKAKWFENVFGKPSADPAAETKAALRKGYLLTLERLDNILNGWNVSAVGRAGDAFDPLTMNAVDIEETDSATDGTVLEVYRAGFEWNGSVYRTAQVRVAREKGGDQ